MTKVKYYIHVETPYQPNNEQKMEILTDLRNTIRTYSEANPNFTIFIGRELTDEDIVESFIKTLSNNKYISEDFTKCIHYDNAQGRNICCNPLVKSRKCNGVCDKYKKRE